MKTSKTRTTFGIKEDFNFPLSCPSMDYSLDSIHSSAWQEKFVRFASINARLCEKADRNIGKYQSGEKVSRFKRITNYLGEVRTELKRLNWPTYSTLTSFTLVTMLFHKTLSASLHFHCQQSLTPSWPPL